jgi:putative alpha-1,2-mannosidase
MHILAMGSGSGKKYVTSVFLNGQRIDGYKLGHLDLMADGELTFAMKDTATF